MQDKYKDHRIGFYWKTFKDLVVINCVCPSVHPSINFIQTKNMNQFTKLVKSVLIMGFFQHH